MEHRQSKRIPAQLALLVFKRGVPIATAWLSDISRDGGFISTGYDDIELNQTLEVEFRLPQPGQSTRRLRAMVVRRDEDGLGVVFDVPTQQPDPVPDVLQWLGERQLVASGL
ncbi:MAG: PilZ domain-containing protein [Marinobacter sp.]|nr:PilZ domain-containing protein [Marinobacter sp.]